MVGWDREGEAPVHDHPSCDGGRGSTVVEMSDPAWYTSFPTTPDQDGRWTIDTATLTPKSQSFTGRVSIFDLREYYFHYKTED